MDSVTLTKAYYDLEARHKKQEARLNVCLREIEALQNEADKDYHRNLWIKGVMLFAIFILGLMLSVR